MEPLIPPNKKSPPPEENAPDRPPQHYYGDIVRRLFIFSAVVMLVTLPFFAGQLSVPIVVLLFTLLLFALFAGIIIRHWHHIAVLHSVVSLVSLIVFEYYAIMFYRTGGSFQIIFWVTQVLAVAFLFALYFSVKILGVRDPNTK